MVILSIRMKIYVVHGDGRTEVKPERRMHELKILPISVINTKMVASENL